MFIVNLLLLVINYVLFLEEIYWCRTKRLINSIAFESVELTHKFTQQNLLQFKTINCFPY